MIIYYLSLQLSVLNKVFFVYALIYLLYKFCVKCVLLIDDALEVASFN